MHSASGLKSLGFSKKPKPAGFHWLGLMGFIVFLWGAGVVICLERCVDLHMVQLMPLPLTVSCFGKIQIGFTFLVPAHLGIPGQRAVKRVCVRVFVGVFCVNCDC